MKGHFTVYTRLRLTSESEERENNGALHSLLVVGMCPFNKTKRGKERG
jgi:hypothetical protein